MLIGHVEELWRFPVKSMAGESLREVSISAQGLLGDRYWALRDELADEMTNAKRLPVLMQCTAEYREAPRPGSVTHVEMTLPDGTRVASDDPKVNELLSRVVGKRVSLWPLRPASDAKHYRRRDPVARTVGALSRWSAFRKVYPSVIRALKLEDRVRQEFGRAPDEPYPDLMKLPREVLSFTSPPGTYFDAYPVHLLTTASLDELRRRNPKSDWDRRRFRPNFFVRTTPEWTGLVEADWGGRELQIGSAIFKMEVPVPRCSMTMSAQPGLPKDPSVLRTIVREAAQNLGVYATVKRPGTARVGDEVVLLS